MHASIYSPPVKLFYDNIIEFSKKAGANFRADNAADYALKVSMESGTSIFKNNGNDEISLNVDTCISENSSQGAEQTVQVKLYRSDGKAGYKKVGFGTAFGAGVMENIIFSYANQPVTGKAALNWRAAIKNGADTGTYRLEFLYNDRAEYLDFVVVK
jgi:hypothetical protein